MKPKAKQPKIKAEPPPKKRKKWKEEFSSSQSDSSPEAQSDEDGEWFSVVSLIYLFLVEFKLKSYVYYNI